MPSHIPCHTLTPTRSSCFAPVYCATKALTYETTPIAKQIDTHCASPACIEASMSAVELHVKKTRSIKCISDVNDVEMIIGSAICITSRAPQGLDHQPVSSATLRDASWLLVGSADLRLTTRSCCA